MFSTTIELDQHSPLLHFQWEQDGLLRMTELRPKLNRFIVKELQTVDPVCYTQYKDIIEQHFKPTPNGNGFLAPYKLWVTGKEDKKYFYNTVISQHKIQDIEKNTDLNAIGNVAYFADSQYINNIIDNRTPEGLPIKLGIMYKHICIHISSWHKELLDLLSLSLKYILVFENFGSRQSKGFGCFTNKGMSKDDFVEVLKKRPTNLAVYEGNSSRNYNLALQKINDDYQLLKSGRSSKSRLGYAKSLLWEYFCELHDIRWEKREIKVTLKDHHSDIWGMIDQGIHPVLECRNDVIYNHMYIRALLGLAENNEYKTKRGGDKVIINISDESTNNVVQRFRSPITFKIFNHQIFMIAGTIPQNLYLNGVHPRMFRFSASTRGSHRIDRTILRLQIPSNFDLIHFLDCATRQPTASPILASNISNYKKIK